MPMQHRRRGVVLATAGLAALVLVLLVTPDGQAWVFGAWVLVLAGVTAVAFGIALVFRHQDRIERAAVRPHYLTADWVEGAQLFTVGDRAEPPVPEPVPDPIAEPVTDPETPPAVLPHPPSEPELVPTGARYPRVAAALMVANAVRELLRTSREAR
jgi:hypothetical protein